MQFVGERFPIDLPEDEEPEASASASPPPNTTPFPGLDFVKDVQERPNGIPRPPSAPAPRGTPTGFPAHKKRTGASRFKQSRQAQQPQQDDQDSMTVSPVPTQPSSDDKYARPLFAGSQGRETETIDRENKEKIANMSETEIAQEREELLQGLPPSLIEKLLRRAKLDRGESVGQQDWVVPETEKQTQPPPPPSVEDEAPIPPKKPKKTVAFADTTKDDTTTSSIRHPTAAADDTSSISNTSHQHPHPPPSLPEDSDTATTIHPPDTYHGQDSSHSHDNDDAPAPRLTHPIHFPSLPAPPPLDPSSPTFQHDLHSKYFPTLPSDPSKLSWMTSSPSSALPSATALQIRQIRFSFTGSLLAPSRSNSIPVTAGLHHHGDAPEKAGYTIGELAHLGRSTVPGQRCVAFQTLGRVLYRLGRGEFGVRGGRGAADEEEEQEDGKDQAAGEEGEAGQEGEEGNGQDNEDIGGPAELERGLWACIKEGRVLETLTQEVNKRGGHMSAKAYATEALWLWQKGGGKQVPAV